MTLAAPMRCSTLAEELHEPMIGTVEQRVRWLLVEDRSPWGMEAARDVLGADLAAAFKRAGIRALLVRRREGDPQADAVRRVILVDTVARRMAATTITSLGELDPAQLAAVPPEEYGAPLTEPMFLVCSNGKRDACCAVRGRLVLAALGERHAGRVWECTHLGGHRFAANLVCLPDGIVYGRVAPDDGPRLVDAHLSGRLDPRALRGRSAWPAPAQVAEQYVRIRDAIDGLTDVELVSATVSGDRAEVSLSVAGARHDLVLRAAPADPARPTSCRADEHEQPLHWAVA